MFSSPSYHCALCPRLCEFHAKNRVAYGNWHNGPVPAFGELSAALLVVGLAPGLKGANRTGRPFTGDYAGIILYGALLKAGFAQGRYSPPSLEGNDHAPCDDLTLNNCRITNAVRCVPPENKPDTAEIKNCNGFLKNEILAMPDLKVIVALGSISHGAVLSALGAKKSAHPFAHGAVHKLGTLTLIDSYHTSRYNINTGRLTVDMFEHIVRMALSYTTTRQFH